jgi:protein O-mannosyl-transferase
MKPADVKRVNEAREAWVVCALLIVGTLAVYWQTAGFEFLSYDDSDYVTANPVVRAGLTWRGTAWAFTTLETGNWLPLTWLSHMLVCQVFDLRAGAHHLLNVALHIGNSVLLLVVLRRMTGALWRSAMVAALFAWHPLHVESVAWVSERKDVLSGLFFMLTLWAYGRYAQLRSLRSEVQSLEADHGPRTTDYGLRTTGHAPRSTLHASRIHLLSSIFYLLSVAFFACGLMSKSMLVTVPFVLLLLDYWPLRRNAEGRMMNAESSSSLSTLNFQHSTFARLFLEKVPFLGLAAAVSVITYIAQERSGAMKVMGFVPFSDRLANAIVSYVRYLANAVWPAGLTVLYPFPKHVPLWQVGGALAMLVLVSALAIRFARRWPWLMVGWCWFLGMLVPVIGVVQVGRQSMADRYTYLPLIGLFIAVVWGIGSPKSRAQSPKSQDQSLESAEQSPKSKVQGPKSVAVCGVVGWRGVAWALAALILVICLVGSWRQVQFWRNSLSLWARALAVTRHNAGAHHAYGFALEQQGRFSEAMEHYRTALQDEPRFFEVHNNLGRLLGQLGMLQEATNHLAQAVAICPTSSAAHANLAHSLAAAGDRDGSREHYQIAMDGDPANPSIPVDWGKAMLAQNRAEEALSCFAQALRLDSRHTDARVGYGFALGQLGSNLAAEGRLEQAVDRYRDALRIQPDLPEVLNNLAWLLATAKEDQVRNGTEAVERAQRACELTHYQQPQFVGTLAAALAEAGKFEEARQTAHKAIILAEASGQKALVVKNRELSRLYEASKPYHDTGH